MIFTLFISPLQQAWPDNVNDPADSKLAFRFDDQSKFNILYKKVEQFELDASSTRSIGLVDFGTSEWLFLVVRCVGTGRVNTAGFDTDGTTPITGKIPVYGNRLLPGIALLSTYNNSSFTVESLADGSLFEVFAAVACTDDDARLDTNA